MMQASDARQIIEALADGLDPTTRQPFQDCPLLQRPEVIRALYKAQEALQMQTAPALMTKSAARKQARAARAQALEPGLAQDAAPGGEQAIAIPRLPPHAGKKWSPEEEREIEQDFRNQQTIEAIAQAHGRTPGSIAARLVKLGCLVDPKLVETYLPHFRPIVADMGAQ